MINAHKLHLFGRATRSMFASLRGEARPLPSAATLSSACASLQRGFISARNAGAYANPWTIAGIGKKETRNSAVLARLWDPVVVGAIGRQFLLEVLGLADPTGELGFPIEDVSHQAYSIVCENCVAGDAANRMDIVIQSLGGNPGWTIVIEAKVDASLGENQLEKYAIDLADRNRLTGRKTYLILLASDAPDALDRAIAHIRWKDVARAARTAASAERSLASPGRLIREFANHIRDFDDR